MINRAMMTSKTCEWETPQAFFDALNSKYFFETDVYATAGNAKCAHYYTREQDGLAQEWSGVCWMNPPYGREIGKWVRKAYESSMRGATVVCLLPARTDTAWWHDFCLPHGKITYVRGRLRFGGAKDSAPFPSAIVVFENKKEKKNDD